MFLACFLLLDIFHCVAIWLCAHLLSGHEANDKIDDPVMNILLTVWITTGVEMLVDQ
jgi:hypothetical protein